MKKLKQIRKELEEKAQFKVDVEGMPPTFMNGKSSAEILAKLRKIVKQPSMIKSVERYTDMEVKRAYKNKAQGREMDEECTDQWYSNQPEWGTNASTKKAKNMTPGQLGEEDYDRKRDAQAERGTRKFKSIGYTSKPVSKETGDKAKAAALAAVKKALNKESTAQIRINRALKKHGVGKNDEFYKSHMDPETRKKYEPKKVERKPVSVEPPKHKPFQWIKTK